MNAHYVAINVDDVTCRCGSSSRQVLLHARVTWLPAFYICLACGNIGQVGVGQVRAGKSESGEGGR